jgi:hypothetical protein
VPERVCEACGYVLSGPDATCPRCESPVPGGGRGDLRSTLLTALGIIFSLCVVAYLCTRLRPPATGDERDAAPVASVAVPTVPRVYTGPPAGQPLPGAAVEQQPTWQAQEAARARQQAQAQAEAQAAAWARQQQLSQAPQGRTVYVTPRGQKYHNAACRYARRGSPVPEAQARARGLKPCGVCGG